MTAAIIFSGGIDSSVLAADVASRPFNYGIVPDGDLHLITIKSGHKKSLGPLVDWIRSIRNGWGEVHHHYEKSRLFDLPMSEIPDGGHQTGYHILSKYAPDVLSTPHTPAMHSWIASLAVNRLVCSSEVPATGRRMVFFGFQDDPPFWDQWDRDKTLCRNDASLDFIDRLNDLYASTNAKVRFAAPFLTNRSSRTAIVRMGEDLGVPWKLTSSCMYGWNPDGCGICAQCIRRSAVFAYEGIEP